MTDVHPARLRSRLRRWFLFGSKEERPAQCNFCVHRRGSVCMAYPGGIPFAILANQVDHRKKYPLDRGIRFAPVSLEADAAQRALFSPPEAEPARL